MCIRFYENFTQMYILSLGASRSLWKITHLISLNCTVFITDTYKWSQWSLQGDWMHFKIAEYFSRLTRKAYNCMAWSVQDNGGVETSDFVGNAHMLFLFIFLVQSTKTIWLRILHCGLRLAYNWLFHHDVTAQHLWFWKPIFLIIHSEILWN